MLPKGVTPMREVVEDPLLWPFSMGVKSRKWMPEEMEAGGGVSRVILALPPHSRQIQYLVLSSQSLPPWPFLQSGGDS